MQASVELIDLRNNLMSEESFKSLATLVTLNDQVWLEIDDPSNLRSARLTLQAQQVKEKLQKSLEEVHMKYGNNKVSPDKAEAEPLAGKSVDEENPESDSEDAELSKSTMMKLKRD